MQFLNAPTILIRVLTVEIVVKMISRKITSATSTNSMVVERIKFVFSSSPKTTEDSANACKDLTNRMTE